MRRKSLIPLLIAAIAHLTNAAMAHEGDPYAGETPAQRDTRMAWWREAKFGMFIHWGVYAVPAGNYDGQPVGGIGEWIMLRGRIPVVRYRAYANDFNPLRYDPAAWAALASKAGMRYVVITAKHHDGFALFPSEASNWDIADATPWKSDLIGPLAEAVRAQGLKFGLYYSQAQDWVHPGGAKSKMPDGGGWDDAHLGDFDSYLDQIAIPQTREILTRYQPDVLWWDTPHLMNPGRARKLAELLALRPGIIHNNRLGGGYRGDTETPEQHVPATGFPGRDWETCMTMNDTWGFKRDDHRWKSAPTLIRNLVDIVSKGGNYLLNVGPTAEGEIPAESVKLLEQVGAWMEVNGESIYGTRASPFRKLPWGRCTMKPAGEDTILYLHVLEWPKDGKLTVSGLKSPVKSAELLAVKTPVAVACSEKGLVLTVPATAPDEACTTIRLIISGKPVVHELPVSADPDGVIRLLPADATLHGEAIQVEEHQGATHIRFWTHPGDTVSWKLRVDHKGKYLVRIESAAAEAGAVLLVQGIGKMAFCVPKTPDLTSYQTSTVGEVALEKGATFVLTLKPVVDAWRPLNIRRIELIPQP